MKLYQLTTEFQQVEAMTGDDGEILPEAFDRLTALEMELAAKLDGCCRMMRHFEARAAVFKAESDRLAGHARSAAASAARLKRYVEDAMKAIGADKIETELFKLRIQNNPPSCDIDPAIDLRLLPEAFIVTRVEANKRAIIAAALEGEILPAGVTIRQTRTIRIS